VINKNYNSKIFVKHFPEASVKVIIIIDKSRIVTKCQHTRLRNKNVKIFYNKQKCTKKQFVLNICYMLIFCVFRAVQNVFDFCTDDFITVP